MLVVVVVVVVFVVGIWIEEKGEVVGVVAVVAQGSVAVDEDGISGEVGFSKPTPKPTPAPGLKKWRLALE